MRSIDLRIPLLVGVAVVLLAFSPARAAAADEDIVFIPGTGDSIAAGDLEHSQSHLPVTSGNSRKGDAQADLLEMSDRLSDPQMQDGVADMVGDMTEKMMDFPIGKFVVAMEQAIPGGLKDKRGKRIRATDTVSDLAGRDADRLPDDLAKGSKQMMGMMSGLAAAFAGMIPEFEKLGREMEKSFEDFEDVQRDRN